MSDKPKILYNSDEAAQLKTVTGWVSRDGIYYGDNEHGARWSGCTHIICDCGAESERGWTACESCRNKAAHERYMQKPFKEWNGEDFVYSTELDKYFRDEQDLIDYIEDNEIKPDSLMLMICVPNYAHEIEPDDIYCDDLPEDMTLEDVYPELAAKFEELNKLIREEKKPISWGEGPYRTEYKITK